MKKIITIVFVFTTCLLNAQAFKGKGDTKAQVGALIQSGGNGISVSADFGLGENFSVGFVASYLLSVENDLPVYDVYANTYSTDNPKFQDRADIKARFNANIGNVIGLPKNMDVYPGLDLGLRNFGAHAGFRYFFTEGFGVFGEAGFPIAKYDSNLNGFDNYNNQFAFTIGASFNLQ